LKKVNVVSSNKWRWIDTGTAAGAFQMAADQTLLEMADETGQPLMRVYQWDPWCISLGYHQSRESIDENSCRKRGVEVVRRPTGGRAVYHAHEVTYAVIIPKESEFYRENLTALYELISAGLVRGLQKLGVQAELQKRKIDLNLHYKKSMSVSCFSAAARNEILVNGKKLVGSAQRHLSWGMLQHGSILTGPAHLDLPYFLKGSSETDKARLRRIIQAKTICLDECRGSSIEFSDAAAALKAGMAEMLDIEFIDSEMTPAELTRAESIKTDFELFSLD